MTRRPQFIRHQDRIIGIFNPYIGSAGGFCPDGTLSEKMDALDVMRQCQFYMLASRFTASVEMICEK